MWIWDKIRGVGKNREDEADLREEFGGGDPGEAEDRYLSETGYGADTGYPGLAAADGADAVEADLDEFKPPRDPAP
jgi:hypothetical protein